MGVQEGQLFLGHVNFCTRSLNIFFFSLLLNSFLLRTNLRSSSPKEFQSFGSATRGKLLARLVLANGWNIS